MSVLYMCICKGERAGEIEYVLSVHNKIYFFCKKNGNNLSFLLSVFRLSARVHAPSAPALIRYFKLNTACQDGPLCKNGNARVNLWHL